LPWLASSSTRKSSQMSEIVDEAQALLSQGNAAAMRQALQLLPWLRKDIGI
jgi:hypothetical protein